MRELRVHIGLGSRTLPVGTAYFTVGRGRVSTNFVLDLLTLLTLRVTTSTLIWVVKRVSSMLTACRELPPTVPRTGGDGT